MSAATPTMRPSASKPALTLKRCSWPWKPATRFSWRSSTHFTGAPARRAAAHTSASSRATTHFWPKPPPTSGATTRRRCSGIPSSAATVVRTRGGTCGEDHRVRRRSRASHSARQARPSSGSAVTRADSKVSSSTSAASSSRASSSGSSWKATSSRTLPSSWTRGASPASAPSIEVTAVPTSYSTATRSAPSSAACGLSAMTSAIGSPAWRTRSRASSGISTATNSGRSRRGTSGSTSSRSAAVRTARTPSTSSAGAVSMASMRAAPCGERAKAMDSTPGRGMSSTNDAVPVRWRGSSARRIGRPTQRSPVAAASWSVGASRRPSPATAVGPQALGVDRLGERAAHEHVGELAAVLGAAVHVAGGLDRRRRRAARLGERLAARRRALERLLGRLDAQRHLVDTADDDARVAHAVAVDVDRDGGRHDREVAVAAGELLQRGVGARAREAHLDEQLAGLEGRREEAVEELRRRHLALAARAGDDDRRVEQHGDHAPLGRGVGVGDRAAERAARADGVVADPARGARQELVAGHELGVAQQLDLAVAREGADAQRVAVAHHVAQVGDAGDVDERGRADEAEVHHRHEALTAGEDLGVLAELGQALERVLDALHPVVLERGGLHDAKARMPVSAWPRMSVWTSSVPSYVATASRLAMWRMTG